MQIRRVKSVNGTEIKEPLIEKFIFNDVRMAPVWLALRLWLGWRWLTSGWGKVNNPAWMDGGAALRGFWQGAVQVPDEGRPQIAFGWYREFIQFLLNIEAQTWFAKLVAVGEVAIGVALILGAFTGIAAFFGAFLNWNFIMAGAASSNGMLGLVALALILAWKTAGWIGLDRWLLPYIGTPWTPADEAQDLDAEARENRAANPA